LTSITLQQAQSLFLAAADMSPAEQEHFLETACGGDRALLSEVESLIIAYQGSTRSIASAVESEASRFIDCQFPGDRLGAYRIVRELGRGGMGAVFLAVPERRPYREVAIKVVKRGMDTDDVLKRFRNERWILANLDHPFIAHLLDGGMTNDGRPYFVMEYVQGQSLDRFCQEQALGLRSRLQLFLRICEPIAYAHRNMVIHRDLKPANILVNRFGEPKLLDFGVAKLLDGNPCMDTAAHMRLFTPEYASPEQVTGLPVTTATDIYSLGSILYELVTGELAHQFTARTPLAIDRAICGAKVARPSRVARNIETGLDSIVLMAMRKEPERRYQSVDHLASDIQRYLNGVPVVAHQDSLFYRARKFVGGSFRESMEAIGRAAGI
jgi:serine/threonine protein kinase